MNLTRLNIINKLNIDNLREYVYIELNQTDSVQFVTANVVVVIVAADDDGVVTIDDDTGEASMMKMMGFSDFSSTKASLYNVCLF